MPDTHSYIGLYGNVAILKGYCDDCDGMAFVIKGKLQCCDAKFNAAPTKYKRECEPENRRGYLPPKAKREVRQAQNDCCFYCHRRFGSIVRRKKQTSRLKCTFDHFVPLSYNQDNHQYNFVAACHICNGLKSDYFFQTSDEAEIFLMERWQAKGYEDVWLLPDE